MRRKGKPRKRKKHKTFKVMCPYCGAQAQFTDSVVVYGRSYGSIYLCVNWPECDAYVGVHDGGRQPKGTLANAELRGLRKRCHGLFDPLWRQGGMSRKAAYNWLSESLGIPWEQTHIGHFDLETCQRMVALFEERKFSWKKPKI